MVEFNKEELGKLPLRERVKRLKELEEQRKKEIEEIDELIVNSEKQLKTEEVAEDIAPQNEEVNITRLFNAEEDEELERKVREEEAEKNTAAVTEGEDEGLYLSLNQAVTDYEELKGLRYAMIDQELSSEQVKVMDNIGERLDKTKYTPTSKEVANVLVASRATLYKIRKYAGLDDINRNF